MGEEGGERGREGYLRLFQDTADSFDKLHEERSSLSVSEERASHTGQLDQTCQRLRGRRERKRGRRGRRGRGRDGGSAGLTMAARSELRLWKRSKYSCRVRLSRKTDLHEVGIWTVARSSADSSVDVPMKSNDRQAHDSFSSQLMSEFYMCMCEKTHRRYIRQHTEYS